MMVENSIGYFWYFINILGYKWVFAQINITFWFNNNASPWMFLPPDILFEYWIEHVAFGLLYVVL